MGPERWVQWEPALSSPLPLHPDLSAREARPLSWPHNGPFSHSD